MVKKNVTTVELSGLTKVQFDKEYNYFFVNNMSGGDVLMSTDLIVEGADGVITIPDGASYGTMHGYATDTVYVKGSGKVQVMGTYSAFNPFKLAVKGGEIKTAVGTNISAKNSVKFPLLGLDVYGRSWQNGTPSADNAVPIESIGDSGSVTVTTCGKNLLSPDSIVVGSFNTSNGVEITTSQRMRTGFLPAFALRITFPQPTKILSIYQYDNNKNFLGYSDIWTDTTSWVINDFIDNCKYIRLLLSLTDNTAVIDNDTLNIYKNGTMIEKDIGVTSAFESYKSTTATITTALPLRGIPVSNNGNYTDGNGQQWVCDMLIYGSGNSKIIKYIDAETFDGSSDERWGLSGSNKRINSDKLSGVAKASESSSVVMPCLCDRLTARSGAETYNGTEGIAFDASANVCIAFSVLADNSDVSAWKDYLAANPVTVVYQLAVPAEVELTEEEAKALLSLRTFDGITNVANSENADMSVKYLTSKAISEAVMPIIAAFGG